MLALVAEDEDRESLVSAVDHIVEDAVDAAETDLPVVRPVLAALAVLLGALAVIGLLCHLRIL